jgi:hypothetical protein
MAPGISTAVGRFPSWFVELHVEVALARSRVSIIVDAVAELKT